MATELHFPDRLYQRGHTWVECQETWENQWDRFQCDVAQSPLLERVQKCLLEWPIPMNLAIYYSPYSLDSRLTLPALGRTLNECPAINSRYFNQEYFFPLFHATMGRAVPRLIMLDYGGSCNAVWGPRPEKITNELRAQTHLSAKEKDTWLADFADKGYLKLIDQSLSEFLLSHKPTRT